MIRLEQIRSEMLDRFERVDRRFAQHEQRLARIDQRTTELGERLEAVFAAVLQHLERLSVPTETGPAEGPPSQPGLRRTTDGGPSEWGDSPGA